MPKAPWRPSQQGLALLTAAKAPKRRQAWRSSKKLVASLRNYVKKWECGCKEVNLGCRSHRRKCGGTAPPRVRRIQKQQKEELAELFQQQAHQT
eukprot:5375397-Pyramimonas_sp.AAC.1